MVGSTICQSMNKPWIAVKGEDYGFVFGKEDIEVLIAQAMGMLTLRLQITLTPSTDRLMTKANLILSHYSCFLASTCF